MHSNQFKSITIGSILGIVIGISKVNESGIGLVISLCLCVVLGLVTVITIDDKLHLYTLPAILISSILSVQLFQAIFIASDNVRYLLEKLIKKK